MSDKHDHYYHSADLGRFGEISENRPELGKKFFDWYTAVFADGALTAREKSLIALAVAHAVQCPYCIDAYSKDTLEKGIACEGEFQFNKKDRRSEAGAGTCWYAFDSYYENY